jgi:alpha-1,6-mannosyltransferase
VPTWEWVGLRRAGRYALLVAATAADLAILRAPRHSVTSVLLVVAAGILVAALVVLEHRRRRLGLAAVAVAIAVTTATAVWTPPRTSNDLWSYEMYGRMVTVHGVSPYDHVPAEFRSDPFAHRVSPRWMHRASVYGPLFVGVATAGAWVAGSSPLSARLFFQAFAALALLITLVVVWRTTRSLAALVFLGLNPVLVVIVVNGGHNDALIGLALLVATLLALRRQPRAAGALIGLAALIKLTAGLALIGLVLWAWRHHLRRFALAAAASSGLVLVVGYLPVLGNASHVLGDADKTVTDGSPWNWLVDRLLRHDAWRNVPNPLAPNTTLTAFFYVGMATVLLLGLILGSLAGRDRRPGPAVGISLAAYPVAAEYAYPWYSAWALPIFAANGLSALGGVVWVQSVVLLAALKLPIGVRGSPLHAVLRVLLTDVAPPLLLLAFVVAALRQYPPSGWRRRPRPRPPATRGAGAAPEVLRARHQGYVDDPAAVVPARRRSPAARARPLDGR